MNTQLRKTIVLAAGLSAAVAGNSGASLVHACELAMTGSVPITAPVTVLYPDRYGAAGDNYLHVPSFSPILQDPRTTFKELCRIFGLEGTSTTLIQVDPQSGKTTSYICSQAWAPPFQPCQGVLIRPSGVSGPVSGVIPVGGPAGTEASGFEVDASWMYQTYGSGRGSNGSVVGQHIFGIPLSAQDVDGDSRLTGEDVCLGLALPYRSEVIQVQADFGRILIHLCGQAPIFTLRPGEAVRLRTAPSCRIGEPCSVGYLPS